MNVHVSSLSHGWARTGGLGVPPLQSIGGTTEICTVIRRLWSDRLRHRAGLEECMAGLQLIPDSDVLNDTAGCCLLKLGDAEAALSQFEKSCLKSPNTAHFRINRACPCDSGPNRSSTQGCSSKTRNLWLFVALTARGLQWTLLATCCDCQQQSVLPMYESTI